MKNINVKHRVFQLLVSMFSDLFLNFQVFFVLLTSFIFCSEFLNDFFKPVTPDIERLKLVKKHKHGRRVKQLEKYEHKMKEERQKRVRERQKEFFGELEVHKCVFFNDFILYAQFLSSHTRINFPCDSQLPINFKIHFYNEISCHLST